MGFGFVLGYAKALSDSEAILFKLDEILNTVAESVTPETAEEAAERKAREEAIPGTAVEVVREIPKGEST